ncbi:MAG: nucleoside transporter [Candidatus Aminicenantes bacterium]|nr:nucleoside transporter [Candidatus Aminicenantes bacterium]
MSLYNLISLLGVFFIPFIAWLFSAQKKNINWRLIFWGIGLQLLFGFFVFIFPVGVKFFLWLNQIVVRLLDCATAGTKFLFGRLALPPGTANEAGETSLGSILAFQALPTVIFFSSLIAGLYHLGIMPWLIRFFARLFTRLMRLSGAESLCVSSQIFVGIESALVIQPHLTKMTASELMTILTGGMATIASTVLGLYVFILQSTLPTIAGHLISASILSAPAALLISKLLLPEREKPETLGLEVKPYYEREDNLIVALINGATSGLKLLGGIISLLLAFLGLLALIDLVLSLVGHQVNSWFGWNFVWNLKNLLGYVFYPFALIAGVPPADALSVARLIGERTVATEVPAYQHLAQLLTQKALISPRSAIIAAYSLCGFAHVASLAIFVGGIGALAPSRLKDLSRLGFRALLAATLACLMTGAVAGFFFQEKSIIFGY